MSGADVGREALELRPDLAVLYTTGYTKNAIIHGDRLDEGVELLTKPFRKTTLARKVWKLLNGPAWPQAGSVAIETPPPDQSKQA